MTKPIKLLLYTIVYNESLFLPKMLESLLEQSDLDFTLLVSDNHSTDGTAQILDEYRPRFKDIITIKPERHLSGIEHGQFAHSCVVGNFKDFTHVMFIGGHDIVSPDTIKHLKAMARSMPASALLYTDTTRLSLAGEPLESYPNSLNTAGINRSLVPFVVLFGVGHNIMSSGIWRADVFAAAKPRFICCAADHLLLCEAALAGPITYTPGGTLFLRDAPTYQPGWQYYVEKHIPEAQRRKGCVHDYTLQIIWLIDILERCIGVSAAQILGQPVYENYFLSAMQLYLIRYGEAAQGFDDPETLAISELYQAIQANDLRRVLQTLTS